MIFCNVVTVLGWVKGAERPKIGDALKCGNRVYQN